jgi:O-antigen ligase
MLSRKSEPAIDAWEGVFAGTVGLWLALALIKFGNPVTLNQHIQTPANLDELLINSWPIAWGYALLALVLIVGCKFWRWHAPVPMWLFMVPLIWLGWQFVSATQTADRALTLATLPHFSACVGAFYIGLFALARVTRLGPFWLGLAGGFIVVLIAGWKQHFGGLEETRRYFYSLPDWQSYPPEFLKKVSSNRIYSTLFYPNALAGVILLLLPASLLIVWHAGRALPRPLRLSIAGSIGVMGLGSLYWSGSKSGWLIVMVQGSLALLRFRFRTRSKVTLLTAALSIGLGLFWLNYQTYFGNGATSVVARFDYWRAAWQTLATNPILGSGPGTFMVSYKKLKRPEAEMARLAHNDFLQQGSDSGWPGLLAYAAWILGGIAMLYRTSNTDLTSLSVWLGLTGMALQSFVEFGLYIPALAWPFFLLLGWLLGVRELRNQIDKPRVPA